MKSIAFLVRYWPFFGGGETVTRLLASEFLRRGYRIHVLYWWDRYENRTYSDDDLFNKNKIDVPGPFQDSLTSQDSYHGLFLRLKEFLKENNIDYIINQWWPAEVFEDTVSTKIISCHHANVKKKDNSKNFLKLLYHNLCYKTYFKKTYPHIELLYQKSDLLVFLAQSYKEEFEKNSFFYSPQKPTAFMHNPCSYTEDIDANECLKNKKKEVLFVGRIYENYKKLTLLMAVWREVLNLGIDDWTLKIVGDGPDLTLAKDTAKTLELTNIEFLGTKNPMEEYKTASIFVMTSAFEGWPMTIVEAQHYGVVPVVMNTFSALSEMLSDKSGIIINSVRPQVMAKELESLMNNKEALRRLANNAIKKAGEYSVGRVVDQWEILLKSF